MLTNKLLSYYNQLLATSVVYFALLDPLQELTSTLNQHINKREDDPNNHHLPTVLAEAANDQDYYEILGVKKDATKQEIHKAFRQLAKKYHPDKNKEKGAQDEFIKIFKAYETLSDEKKRKEYDEGSKVPNHGSFNGRQTNGMNDFDMNEFFKQYEDQFFKHAQYYNHQNHGQHHHHNQHHARFSFHGVNLDDLFHDIDEDEFSSFGRLFDGFQGHQHHGHHMESDGSFGDGASFFGSHFPSQLHDTIHQYQHHQNIYAAGGSRDYTCQTVTKNVNGMMMTQTSCM